jgi:Mce-associated membrane protein
MTYQTPRKSRANLFAIIGIAAVLVVGGVVAIVVVSARDSETAEQAPTTTAASADTRVAEERDAALADGGAAVEVFNTLDFRQVEADLDRWESVATGELLTDLRDNRERYVTEVAEARSAATGTVLDAGLTELDERAGTARLIAAVSVEVTVEGQQPTTKQTRATADLERTDDGWKISRLSTL